MKKGNGYFRIRQKSTGKFLNKGYRSGEWVLGPRGHVWKSYPGSALDSFAESGGVAKSDYDYELRKYVDTILIPLDDLEVVSYELVEKEVVSIGAETYESKDWRQNMQTKVRHTQL